MWVVRRGGQWDEVLAKLCGERLDGELADGDAEVKEVQVVLNGFDEGPEVCVSEEGSVPGELEVE